MLANKPYVIGLTGGIGCGKSEAAKFLRTLGAAHLDADVISRELTAAGGAALPEIRRVFGEAAFNGDGTLDRASLGRLVFGNEPARRALEGIIHPLVQREMLTRMDAAAKAGAAVVILDVPLLFETGMDALCDETWLISCDEDVQLERLMERDSMDEDQAKARIASQMSLEDKTRRATVVIDNRGQLDRLYAQLSNQYQALVKKVNRLDREDDE